MPVNFFRRGADAVTGSLPPLTEGLQIRCWQPDSDGYPPPGSRNFVNHFWWALAKTGGFRRGGFAEIRIEQCGRVLNRLIVTPAWYRFPFMAKKDLQIGAVWTEPDARRRQLARAAIGEAHRRFGGDGTRFWYITDSRNSASEALARACGYELVATGKRTRRFGSRLLGQYVIDRYL